MNAVVVFETARRAVRAIVVSAEERRLHHGTFLAPVTQEKQRRRRFKLLAAAVHPRESLLEGQERFSETKDNVPPLPPSLPPPLRPCVENIEIRCSRRAACEFC
jgi:alkylhydroperoxidase family enzyme